MGSNDEVRRITMAHESDPDQQYTEKRGQKTVSSTGRPAPATAPPPPPTPPKKTKSE